MKLLIKLRVYVRAWNDRNEDPTTDFFIDVNAAAADDGDAIYFVSVGWHLPKSRPTSYTRGECMDVRCFSNFFFLVTNSWQSVAVLTTWCQVSLSSAFLQVVWTPQFWGWTSSSITLSQVDLGRQGGLRQSGGGCSFSNWSNTIGWNQ